MAGNNRFVQSVEAFRTLNSDLEIRPISIGTASSSRRTEAQATAIDAQPTTSA
jgi:hypothetical protein